jgi:micrococcal nuclease
MKDASVDVTRRFTRGKPLTRLRFTGAGLRRGRPATAHGGEHIASSIASTIANGFCRHILRLCLFVTAALPVAAAPSGEQVKVIWVVDGDTIGVSYKGRWELVRLLRIDTPERDTLGYAAASEYLRNLVAGKTVTLEFEKEGEPERDRYGRLLAYLHFRGENVNVEIVRAGWSAFWTKYGAGKHADAFRQAETEALTAARGLWAMEKMRVGVEEKRSSGPLGAPDVKGWWASKNSRVYHPCSCPSVKTIDPENLIWFATEEEAKATGRRHCRCSRR